MWTFNTIRIYVSGEEIGGKQLIAELNPIGGGSVYHNFGYENDKLTISGVIVGKGHRDGLLALKNTGNSYELVGDFGSQGDYFVKDIKFKRRLSDKQTIRQDVPATTPVYDFTMELLEDV